MAGGRVKLSLALGCLVLLAGCGRMPGVRGSGPPAGSAGDAPSGTLEAQAISGLAVSPVIHQGDIWLIPSEGGEPVRITSTGRAWDPALSPDGGMLVYVLAPASESDSAELRALTLDSGESRSLAVAPPPWGAPVWSPDGALVAWPAGEQLLVLRATDGEVVQSLATVLPDMSRPDPAWSDDGMTVYIPRWAEDELALWALPVQGDARKVVPLDPALPWAGAPATEGGLTLWHGGVLHLLEEDMFGEPVPVPEYIGAPLALAWSPDGSHLALLDTDGSVWVAERGSWPDEPSHTIPRLSGVRWTDSDSLLLWQSVAASRDETVHRLSLSANTVETLSGPSALAIPPLGMAAATQPELASAFGALAVERPYDWYRYQGEWDSGAMASSNCGPTSVAMAIQFARDNLWVPISDIRAYIGGSSWTYASSLRSALTHWGVGHRALTSMSGVDAALARGSIVLAHVWMYHLSPGADYMVAMSSPSANTDRYYTYDQSHWLVLKGTSADGRWIITYDPNVWDGRGVYWYRDNAAKGRDRLYRYSEMAAAIAAYNYELIEVYGSGTPPGPTPTTVPTATPVADKGVWHTVRSGESLYRIALWYSTTVAAIAEANGLADPNRIYVGQQLWIPQAGGSMPAPTAQPTAMPSATPTRLPPSATPAATMTPTTLPVATPTRALTPTPLAGTGLWHTVGWGDTLSGIALRYGVTVQAIMQANGLANANLVRLGQRLWIPTGGAAPAPTPTRSATPTTVPGAERWHVVVRGETLSIIAARYGTTWQAIAGANGLYSWSIIYPGQRLRIP